MPKINREALSTLAVALPSPAEQEAIVESITEDLSSIDTLVTEATRAITLLRERRAALISAAVTGKIDVRGLVPETEVAA